jgi:sporadic carbohydrate cluster protein (TIGR04323 family)
MKLKGYIFSRDFFGERVPQNVQNIVLRDYCEINKYTFLLSGTEYTFKKSSYILFEILDKLNNYNGILFYSLYQLPEDKEKRKELFKKIIHKKKQIHFALENIILKKIRDVDYVEKIFLLKQSIISDKKETKGKLLNFVNYRHKNVERNYLKRMNDNKINCMKISKLYSKDYWDGDRRYGYGGYRYIKDYHKHLAQSLIKEYNLTKESKILDLGCGKGFLAYEIQKILKSNKIFGCDFSKYAIKNSKKELKNKVFYHDMKQKLQFESKSFDLVLSINVLHNFRLKNLEFALKEIERVGKHKFICVESYKNDKQQFNLQCWALTAETLIDTNSWKWMFSKSGYNGDYEFIYFN